MAFAMARGKVVADLFVKGKQANRIALQVEEVSERTRQRVSILIYGVRKRAVAHRAAVIDQEVAAQIGLILEFFDVKPIAAGVEAPIEVAQVVARTVLTILGELDGKAVVGAAVQSVPETFNNHFGAQLKVFDRHQSERID